jgi:hypothetical protein
MKSLSCSLLSEASRAEDQVQLLPSLQSLGNPGTTYAEQREFPSVQRTGHVAQVKQK